MRKVANCGIIDQILSYASYKQSKELKKSDGSKRQRITGGRVAHACTPISKALHPLNSTTEQHKTHCTTEQHH